jgi:tripartite-type tricarboxylate transporter receptor subunit TctC
MAAGTLTSRELTAAYLNRITHIDRAGPKLNSVIELNPDALAAAETLDAERKAGRVRGLAVTGPKRSPVFPDVPTLIEAVVAGYEATTWHGVVVPAGTPKAIVVVLNAKLNLAVNSPIATERITALGSEPLTGTPEAFWELVRIEHAKWAEVIRRAGAKID